VGAVDSPKPREHKGKKGFFSHKKHRVGVRIDMTPFVDIAFLLLIFFMTTTVFRTPQALEINLPPDEDIEIEVAQSKVLSIYVQNDERVFWRRGTDDPWARTTMGDLGSIFSPYRGNKEIIVLIKIDREAKFDNMVKAIDHLDLASLTRFSLTTMTPEDIKEVEAL
jgi:biopolymer transport protein ExbD